MRVLKEGEVDVNGTPAWELEFEVTPQSSSRSSDSANAPLRTRTRVLVVHNVETLDRRADRTLSIKEKTGRGLRTKAPVALVLGHANDSDDYEKTSLEFDRFLSRFHVRPDCFSTNDSN